MAVNKPDAFQHNNPDLAFVDAEFVRGGGRVVANLTALYALVTKVDQLKTRVTKVWVESESKTYVLKDIANVNNVDGWEIEASGIGPAGADGRGIQSTSYNPSTGILTITFTDSSTYQTGDLRGPAGPAGATGATGAAGAAGAAGKGIQSTAYNSSTGILTITFTDSSTFATGDLRGSSGAVVLTTDIPVNLSGGRTFGKYATGSTIPAIGKTLEEVIRMAALESINPTATVSVSGGIVYNASAGVLTIAMTNTINNPGATVTGFVLSYRRGTGAWVQLYSGAAKASHTHDVAALLATDKTSSFSYQLIVTDSLSTSVTVTSNAITPAGYSQPTTNIAVSGTRELGNISTLLAGNVSQTAQNDVSITSRTLEYSLNNSTWVPIAAGVLSNAISYTHNDATLVNATIIYYHIVIVCSTPTGNQTTTLPLGSVSFVYKNAFGYSATATGITLATLLAMGNNVLTNAKAKTVVATAPSGQYTYYAYCAAAGDLAGIIMDGVTPVIGAFTKLADITGTNSFGATVTYRVYKSNAPAAFTSNSLVIT